MGMHTGLLVLQTDWLRARPILEAVIGTLEFERQLKPNEWWERPEGVDVIDVAQRDGSTYMTDRSMVLSTNPDFVVNLSRELGCLVVGAGAETVSGSFWLVVAEAGELRRLHWNIVATLLEPLDIGDPFPSEGQVDLEDIDGLGILAVLVDLGFDKNVYSEGTVADRWLWPGASLPPDGELSARINAHVETHERPDADTWMQRITVVDRSGSPLGGGGLWALIKRLFGRG